MCQTLDLTAPRPEVTWHCALHSRLSSLLLDSLLGSKLANSTEADAVSGTVNPSQVGARILTHAQRMPRPECLEIY